MLRSKVSSLLSLGTWERGGPLPLAQRDTPCPERSRSHTRVTQPAVRLCHLGAELTGRRCGRGRSAGLGCQAWRPSPPPPRARVSGPRERGSSPAAPHPESCERPGRRGGTHSSGDTWRHNCVGARAPQTASPEPQRPHLSHEAAEGPRSDGQEGLGWGGSLWCVLDPETPGGRRPGAETHLGRAQQPDPVLSTPPHWSGQLTITA